MGLYREKYIFQIFSCPGPQKIHNGGNYCGIFSFFFKSGVKSQPWGYIISTIKVYIYIYFFGSPACRRDPINSPLSVT